MDNHYNFDNNKFILIAKKMLILEFHLIAFLTKKNWQLVNPLAKTKTLQIQFVKNEGLFDGTIVLLAENQNSKVRFVFYVEKSYKLENITTTIRKDLSRDLIFSQVKNKIFHLADDAVAAYESWSGDSIVSFVKSL